MTASPQKILVVRNDKLGDFMLTCPTFALLREALPAARIDALVQDYTAPMAERFAGIDTVIRDPGPGWRPPPACAFPKRNGKPRARHSWRDMGPGHGGSANNLSLKQYAELIRRLDPQAPWRVVITAGPGEADQAGLLAGELPEWQPVVHVSEEGRRPRPAHRRLLHPPPLGHVPSLADAQCPGTPPGLLAAGDGRGGGHVTGGSGCSGGGDPGAVFRGFEWASVSNAESAETQRAQRKIVV